MNDRYHSEDREILRDLYADKDWKEIYVFHEKYLLSPAQVSRSVRKLEQQELIEILDHRIRMTDHGRKWLLANRRRVFFDCGKLQWKNPHTGFSTDHQRRDEHIPRPGKMSHNFFVRFFDEVS